MKTMVVVPEGWTAVAERADGVSRYQAPDGEAWLEIDPLAAMPEDRKGWGERVLGRDLPDGAALEQVGLANLATQLGWPVTVVATVIKDAAGLVIEHRLS